MGARLDSTVEQLSPLAYRLWLRLSMCDVDSVPEWMAFAVSDRPGEDTQRLLDSLVNAHLLTVTQDRAPDGPRYSFNPLVRDHARQRAATEFGALAGQDVVDRIALAPSGREGTAGMSGALLRPDKECTVYGTQAV
ncbi:hypothetical protein STENM223S_05277 [Streptomyces tendae]